MNEIDYKKDLPDDIEGLRLELRKQMDNIIDETDVERIRTIVNKMDEIEPMEMPPISTEEFPMKFNEEIYPKAVKMREEIEQIRMHNERMIRKRNKRQRVWVNVLRPVFSMIVAITILNICTISFAGFNIFKPIVSWTDKVFKKNTYLTNNENESRLLHSDIENIYLDYESVENEFGIVLYKPQNNVDKYKIDDFEANDLSTITYVSILNLKDDFEINYLISIVKTKSQSYEQSIEKIDDEVEILKKDDIEFWR